MKTRRHVMIALLLLAGIGIGCTSYDQAATARLMYAGTECPDADDVADAENMDTAELGEDTPLNVQPLCWYRVDVDFNACKNNTTGLTFDTLHDQEQDDLKPTPDGVDRTVGRIFCIDGGELILLRQADARAKQCPASGNTDHVLEEGVAGWASDHMHADTLLKEDQRPGYHVCHYALTTKHTSLNPNSCNCHMSGPMD